MKDSIRGHIRLTHPPDYYCGPFGCVVCDLFICAVCGGSEGSLLPECPGRRLTSEEDQQNYKHYCDGTGPFEGQNK